METLADRLGALLNNRKPHTKPEWEARPAAVLIPIFHKADEWHLVYTRRTDEVENHRGQVSFPGGLIEQQDSSALETALREAEEEIGLQKDAVEILGTLDVLLTITQFQVLPFVGKIPWPYEFTPNPNEVARVFSVPLSWLLNSDNLELRYRYPIPDGPSVPVYYFKPYQEEIIWGATARITLNLLEIIKPIVEK